MVPCAGPAGPRANPSPRVRTHGEGAGDTASRRAGARERARVIAIIGGGLTGLALGHQLTRLGVPHLVLEAEDRPGGVIRSGRVEGHLLEWGPQRTRLG